MWIFDIPSSGHMLQSCLIVCRIQTTKTYKTCISQSSTDYASKIQTRSRSTCNTCLELPNTSSNIPQNVRNIINTHQKSIIRLSGMRCMQYPKHIKNSINPYKPGHAILCFSKSHWEPISGASFDVAFGPWNLSRTALDHILGWEPSQSQTNHCWGTPFRPHFLCVGSLLCSLFLLHDFKTILLLLF